MEFDKFYSSDFKKQFEDLNQGLDTMLTTLLGVAEGMDKVNDKLKDAEKTRKKITEADKEIEKLNREKIKTQNDIIKQQQLIKKSEIEQEKLAQQKIRTQQQEQKLTQDRIKTQVTVRKERERLQKQEVKNIKTQKSLLEEYKTEIKTAKDATEQNKRLRNMRNSLDVTGSQYEKRLGKINKLIDRNNKLIKSQADEEKKRTLNIGRYSEALDGLTDKITMLGGGFRGMSGSVKKFSKALGGLLLNPVVLAVAALVAAIAAVGKAVARTQKFQDKWKQGLAGLRAAVDTFQGNLYKLINGRGGFKDFNKALDDAIERAIKLEKRSQNLTKAQLDQERQLNKLTFASQLFKSAADDATRSFQERTELAEKAYNFETQRLEQAISLAKEELDINAQVLKDKKATGLDLTNEELKRNRELVVAYDNLVFQKKQADVEYNKFKRELRLDDFEQELDFILDVADKRKTANEKIINDETKTVESRQKLLDQTRRLLNESFDDQINLFEAENKINIDRDKLLTLNNKESFEYARSLGMSERATNRLLEVIRERIAATSDLTEAQKGINKTISEQQQKALEDQLKRLKEQQKISEDIAKEVADYTVSIEEEVEAELDEIYQKELEAFRQKEEEKTRAAEEQAENRKTVAQAAFDFGVQLANTLFELNQQQYAREGEALEERYSVEQKMAGDNIAAQRAADRKYAREKAKIDRKQAQAEKEQALFNVAINAAVGFTQALAQGGVAGILLGALVLASAAVQAVAISSQPLPKVPAFDKGTKSAPGGLIAVAEKRPEIIKEKGKKPYLQMTPLITDKLKGAEITGGAETDYILKHAMNTGYDDQMQQMKHGFKAISKSIKDIKIEFGYNRQGDPYAQRKEAHKITYSDYYK